MSKKDQKNPPGKAVLGAWSIAIPGFWNRMIFTPKFVDEHIFKESSKVSARVPYLPEDPITYKDENLSLTVHPARLEFEAISLKDMAITASEIMSIRLLEKLNDTPIKSVALNMVFTGVTLPGSWSTFFRSMDRNAYRNVGWTNKSDFIVREVQQEEKRLYVALSQQGSDITANFRFVFDTPDCDAAIRALRRRTRSYWEDARKILKHVYQVESDDII